MRLPFTSRQLFAAAPQPASLDAPTGSAGTDGQVSQYGDDAYMIGLADANPIWRDWRLRYLAINEMRRSDPIIAALLWMLTLPIRGASWDCEPATKDPEGEEVAAGVTWQFGLQGEESQMDLSHDGWLEQRCLKFAFGSMFEEILWNPELTTWTTPSGDDRQMRTIRRMAPRFPASVQKITVDPLTGKLKTIEQNLPETSPIPGDKLAVYVLGQEGLDFRGNSILRPMWGSWKAKHALLVSAAIAWDRWASGIPIVRRPMGSGRAAREEAQAIGRNLRVHERAWVELEGTQSEGWDVDIRTATINDPVNLLRHYDQQLANAALQMFTQLGTSATGSRAVGETLSDSFYLAVVALAKEIAEETTKQAVRRFVDVNFGPDVKAPRITVSKISAHAAAEVINAVALLVGAGFGQLTNSEILNNLLDLYDLPHPPEGASLAQEGAPLYPAGGTPGAPPGLGGQPALSPNGGQPGGGGNGQRPGFEPQPGLVGGPGFGQGYAGFDPAKHPHVPGGEAGGHGGEWAKKLLSADALEADVKAAGFSSTAEAKKEAELLNGSPYTDKPDKELLDISNRFGLSIQRLKYEPADAMGTPSPHRRQLTDAEQEQLAGMEARYQKVGQHLRARKLAVAEYRRRSAVESAGKGKLVLGEEEVAKLLGNPGDTYKDAGYHGDYNPDLFRTSDLSGKPIRYYVVLPDGRVGHPDEIKDARRRGRIVVAKEAPIPPPAERKRYRTELLSPQTQAEVAGPTVKSLAESHRPFEEARHPRAPKGTPTAGEWIKLIEGSAADLKAARDHREQLFEKLRSAAEADLKKRPEFQGRKAVQRRKTLASDMAMMTPEHRAAMDAVEAARERHDKLKRGDFSSTVTEPKPAKVFDPDETMRLLDAAPATKEWVDSLSPAEKAAIDDFVSQGGHRDINLNLRTGSIKWGQPLGEHEQEVEKNLRSALARARTPTDLTTYRRIAPEDLQAQLRVASLDQAAGHEFTEAGFSSTSVAGRGIGRYPAMLRIAVPRGTNAAYLGELSGFSEREMLFPPGLRLRITHVGHEQGSTVLDAKII